MSGPTQQPNSLAAVDSSPIWRAPVLYPDIYAWYVFFAALDFLCTWLVLSVGGYEANPIAAYVLQQRGLAGMGLYKFILVAIIVTICEIVGRMRYRRGKLLALTCVIITITPVVMALTQLYIVIHRPELLETGP